MEEVSNLKIYQPESKDKKSFHIKMVILEYPEKSFIYLGSANFTNQGFFNNLNEKANNECGLIIVTKNLEDIKEWLKKGWSKPKLYIEWIDKKDLEDEKENLESKEPYAWAERRKEKNNEIKVFIYLPDNKMKNNLKIENKKAKLTQIAPLFYETSINLDKNKAGIEIKINGQEPFKILVFDEEKYEKARIYDGETLFSYKGDKIYRINENEVSEAIIKDGVSVSVSNSVTSYLIDPPVLEQLYSNIKDNITAVEKRKQFYKSHLDELSEKLKEQKGACGLYLISRLYEVFYKKDLKEFCKKCDERIKSICEESNIIEYSKFSKFLNNWIKNK